jgi:hypothetical protein
MYILAEDLNTKYFGKALYDLQSRRSDYVYACLFVDAAIKWCGTNGLILCVL